MFFIHTFVSIRKISCLFLDLCMLAFLWLSNVQHIVAENTAESVPAHQTVHIALMRTTEMATSCFLPIASSLFERS